MYYLIITILLFVIYGSFMLSRRDYKKKDICPKVFGIPACYYVFVFFVGTLAVHLLNLEFPYLYFGLLAVPFFLALKGSLTELSGTVICPRTPGGTPMCYISLGFCTLLIGLKIFSF
jgi:hypothetical protein